MANPTPRIYLEYRFLVTFLSLLMIQSQKELSSLGAEPIAQIRTRLSSLSARIRDLAEDFIQNTPSFTELYILESLGFMGIEEKRPQLVLVVTPFAQRRTLKEWEVI